MKIKELEKEEKEHILVEELQLAFRVRASTKEIDLCQEKEKKKRRRRKTVSKQKGGFIGSIVSALAPTAIDLVTKLIR